MTTLREQIEALRPPEPTYQPEDDAARVNEAWGDCLDAVLDVIDAHECYDRDRLARALTTHRVSVLTKEWADAIIAALREQG